MHGIQVMNLLACCDTHLYWAREEKDTMDELAIQKLQCTFFLSNLFNSIVCFAFGLGECCLGLFICTIWWLTHLIFIPVGLMRNKYLNVTSFYHFIILLGYEWVICKIDVISLYSFLCEVCFLFYLMFDYILSYYKAEQKK